MCVCVEGGGGGGGGGTLLGEAFPMSIFLWNLVNWIYFFWILDQDGFEIIWLL